MEHFKNPRNVGEISDGPNIGIAKVGNVVCGDIQQLFIKIGKRLGENGQAEEYIEDVKFKTLGCGAAIATSSMATELLKGQSLAEAEKLTNQAVAEALGGLPPSKMHCSVLAAEAVQKAIEDYRKKQKTD